MMPDETTNNFTPRRNSFLAGRIGYVVITIICAIVLVAFAFILRFVHQHNDLFHDQQAADSSRHNLLSDTASSVSRILAGAGLAKYQDLLTLFETTYATVTTAITGGEGPASVLGGALILYFGLAGFIAGLVLPAYF